MSIGLTGILSASRGHAIRRNAAMLPAYSLMLGLLALFGFFALAAGVAHTPEFAQGFKEFGNNFAVPALFLYAFPSWFVGLAFAAIGIGALVPAATVNCGCKSLHAEHPPRVPAVLLGAYTRWFDSWVLLIGWVVGIITGTAMAYAANLTRIYPLTIGGFSMPGYTAFYTLLILGGTFS